MRRDAMQSSEELLLGAGESSTRHIVLDLKTADGSDNGLVYRCY